MVGLRVFDVGLLLVWLVWFFRLRDDDDSSDEGGRDLFVHHTGIHGQGFRTLQENAKVSYEQEEGDKGPKAVNVEKL